MPPYPIQMPSYPGQMPSNPGEIPPYPGAGQGQMPSYPAQMPSYPGQIPSYPGQIPSQIPSYPGQVPTYPSQGMPNYYAPTQQQYPPMPNQFDNIQNVNYSQQQAAGNTQQATTPVVSKIKIVFLG